VPAEAEVPSDDPKLEAIGEAKVAADIDGYGDEGAGYDLAVFARELEARGWRYEPPEASWVHAETGDTRCYPESDDPEVLAATGEPL
jgi:hypothetical protein